MVGIFIALCILAVGKIRSQEVVASLLAETKTLHLSEYRPTSHQKSQTDFLPPRLSQNYAPLPQYLATQKGAGYRNYQQNVPPIRQPLIHQSEGRRNYQQKNTAPITDQLAADHNGGSQHLNLKQHSAPLTLPPLAAQTRQDYDLQQYSSQPAHQPLATHRRVSNQNFNLQENSGLANQNLNAKQNSSSHTYQHTALTAHQGVESQEINVKQNLAPLTYQPTTVPQSVTSKLSNAKQNTVAVTHQLAADQDVGNQNFNLQPPTLKVNQPNKHLFISRVVPEKTATTTKCSGVCDNVDMYEGKLTDRGNTVPPSVSHNVMINPPERGVMPQEPVKITNTVNITGITIEERDSFNGDKCPEGYIRVNGTCAKKDESQ